MQEFKYIYPFIYDEEKIKNINLESISHKNSFLIYLDKLFLDECKKDRVKKLDVSRFYNFNKQSFFITDLKKDLFKFKFENIEICFFPNNIALLVLEVSLEELDIDKIYKFNKMFAGLYKQQDDIYILKNITLNKKLLEAKKENILNKKLPEEKKELWKEIFNLFDSSKKLDKNNIFPFLEELSKDNLNNINKKKSKKSLIQYRFTLEGIRKLFDKYNYKDKYDSKQRIGLLKEEQHLLKNKTFEDLHFAEFDVIIKVFKDNPFRLIHFDTFITSLFVRFVKLNKSIEYYDNFNPLNTNYMSVYAMFKDSDLNKLYNENFAKYEPFINNKKKSGVIKQNDFFKTFQAQADWFIIANSNNLLHIVKPEIYDNIRTSVNSQRFLVFLFTTFQYVYLSMLESKIIVSNSKNLLKQITFINDSLNEYLEFLNNYYFSDISDEPALNEYYHFLQKVKNLEEKVNHIKNISVYNKSFKEIFHNIINNKVLLFFIVVLTPLVFNILNAFYEKLINVFNSFILNSKYVPLNIVFIEFLLLPFLLPLIIEYLEKQECEKNKFKKFYKKDSK